MTTSFFGFTLKHTFPETITSHNCREW